MTNDTFFKIPEEMFKMLVSGKEVIMEQSDGTKLHFILEDMGYDRMLKAIHEAMAFKHRTKYIVPKTGYTVPKTGKYSVQGKLTFSNSNELNIDWSGVAGNEQEAAEKAIADLNKLDLYIRRDGDGSR